MPARARTPTSCLKRGCRALVSDRSETILKSECCYLTKYGSIHELKNDIDEYIHYYNHERISLRLKGLSPVEYRTQTLKAA